MGKTSVTGVGGYRTASEHMTLGVNHLIGPRFTEKWKWTIIYLLANQVITYIILLILVLRK